jgi:hypothetical protein
MRKVFSLICLFVLAIGTNKAHADVYNINLFGSDIVAQDFEGPCHGCSGGLLFSFSAKPGDTFNFGTLVSYPFSLQLTHGGG